MTDLRKAAEMALEALENVYGKGKRCEAAIKELRQALAEPKQESLGGEWVPCVKLPVIVHVRNQRNGETHISTREGITPVLPDDLIMRGVAGEEYPIGRELFERTYTFDTSPEQESVICRNIYEVWAGSDGVPIPETIVEAYLLRLIKQMRDEASKGLKALYTAPPKKE
jgi:hypothetical protein